MAHTRKNKRPAVSKRTRKRLAKLRSRQSQIESLEQRQMLTVASDPAHSFASGNQPLDIKLAPIDAGTRDDLAAISTSGELTVALNQDDNSWQSIQTTSLGLGPLNGMELTVFDFGPFSDVIVQGPDSVSLLTGDGTGQFALGNTVTPGAAGTLAPSGGGRIGMHASFLDTDFNADLVTVAPGTNEVLVFTGDGSNQLSATPDRYPSGASEPIVARIGNVIGNAFQDVVVGHSDGSVTWFEGVGDGTLVAQPALTVTGLGSVADLSIADFDGDGDNDVAVSGGTQVTILSSDDDPLGVSPIVNGDFSLGMTGWQTEIVGHDESAVPGRVNTLGGFAQLTENESFLVSLHQTFTIPPTPQTIQFDIESLGLDLPNGGVPDAFEVSLLDAANTSLVPTHTPTASSFFNANPDGATSTAAGVTFDGRTVTLDISSVAPGTEATLYFDLVGNPPGTSSVASVDNVSITPDFITSDTSTSSPLAGPFLRRCRTCQCGRRWRRQCRHRGCRHGCGSVGRLQQ